MFIYKGERKTKAKRAAFMGLLFALALTLSWFESLLPAVPGLPPGIKIGLSNIITMFCLFIAGIPYAVLLAVLKALFAFIIRGAISGILSLSGGLVSVVFMTILLLVLKDSPSTGFISICGACMHNAAQLSAASFIVGSGSVFYYLPILLISGVIMGVVTGLIYRNVNPYLARIPFMTYNEKVERKQKNR